MKIIINLCPNRPMVFSILTWILELYIFFLYFKIFNNFEIYHHCLHFFIFVFLATHLQRAPTSGAVLPSGSASWVVNGGSGLSQSLQLTQQKLRLQQLQMERERLKIRQQEIIRQVSFIYIDSKDQIISLFKSNRWNRETQLLLPKKVLKVYDDLCKARIGRGCEGMDLLVNFL